MIARIRNWAVLNPLARLALAAVVGITLIEQGVGVGRESALLFLAAASCITALFCPHRFPLEVPVALVFAFIHQVRLDETRDHRLRAELIGGGRVEALVTGYLTPAVELGGGGGDGERQQVTLDATDIVFPTTHQHLIAPTRLRAWMTPKEPLPPAGVCEVRGRLRIPQGPTNPGQFDSAAYALRQGFVADMDVRSVRVLRADPLPFLTWFLNTAERSRDWISRQLETGIEGEKDSIALIRGMVLGLSDETSADLQRPFRNTGTLHIFSVSGLHVALISSIGWTFLGALRVRRNHAMLILIPGMFVYAFITGWRPPAARAAIMVTLFMAAVLFDRRSRLQNSLGAAALFLLAADTQPAFTAGFQLSFGVLWAIALFAGPLLGPLRPWAALDPFLPPQIASWDQHRWAQIKTWLAGMVSVSIAATVGSLPLMLWHFGLATPVSVLANCVLIPLAFFVLATASVSLVFGSMHLGIAQLLANNANWFFAKAMLVGAVWFSKIPGAWFIWQPGNAAPSAPFALTVLHLPYGEAAQHLRVRNDHWLLDTGTRRSLSRIVQPFLLQQSAEHLAGVILSHSDIEHVGGAASALGDDVSAQAFVSILEPSQHQSGASSLKRFFASRESSAAPQPRFLCEGDEIDFGSGARATVLYPSTRDLHDKGDDRALVLLIEIDGFRILWCNDSGFIGEKTILERHLLKSLRCDVLIRNQHAADFTALPEFLLAVRPKIIVTSNVPFVADQRMPASLAEYARKRHATLFDQDAVGAVTINVENQTLTATAFVTGQTVTLEKKRPSATK